MEELLRVDAADWQKEADEIGAYFKKFGDRLPPELRAEQAHLSERLNLVTSAKG
jgi:phosphoenolpyruvate carboxykinase (GTP)